ncbi:TPA: hypothetical protein N0F65_007119, partial [Lagenidium giganteum]
MFVVTFDGSAKPKRAGGGFSGILWRLDGWFLEGGVKHVILCGDSNLVIRQLRGDMACNTPALKVLKMRVEQLFSRFSSIQFLHMKREFNQPADLLAGQAMQRAQGLEALDQDVISDLVTLNRLPEILDTLVGEDTSTDEASPDCVKLDAPKEISPDPSMDQEVSASKLMAVTRSELWICTMKKFLRGDLGDLTEEQLRECKKISDSFLIDQRDCL